MPIPIYQFIPPTSSFPWYPHICSLPLCLCFCFASKFTCIIFLDSTYKLYYVIFVFLTLHCVWQSLSLFISLQMALLFLSVAEYYSTVCIYFIFFMHFSVNGLLDCFHVLAVINSTAVNFGVPVYFWIVVFSGYMPRSGIAGSYGSSIFSFFFCCCCSL